MLKGIFLSTCLVLGGLGVFSQTENDISPVPDSCLYIPNAITINCDWSQAPLSYPFKPILICDIYGYQLLIDDLYGETVFESTDANEYWDASEFPDGMYLWQITGYMGDEATPIKVKREGQVAVIK